MKIVFDDDSEQEIFYNLPVLPLPLFRDFNGKLFDDYFPADWWAALQEQ